MATRLPTAHEIDELVSFLPRLYAEGFRPIRRWGGGTEDEKGAITMPWPEYDPVVDEFVSAASREWWTDYHYSPENASRMLVDEERIRSASLEEIKAMLTFFIRGERFCDGHWAAMIEQGHIRRLLTRLGELRWDREVLR